MSKIKLCIVVGHSNKRPGARNKNLGINEFILNENLAKEIANVCEKQKIPYILTYRENGYSKLPAEINKLKPTHTICIHHNASSNKNVNGCETLYYKNTKVSNIFAKLVNNKMAQCLKIKNRGIKSRTEGERGGHVLKNTFMPCILLEPYFMSNDTAVLDKDEKLLAKVIIDGFLDFLDEII